MYTLIPFWFLPYKFFNSLFLGLSIGSIFILYAPLEPSVYSLGGVILAVGTLLVARLYGAILNVKWFFRISLFVEIVLLAAMCYFLIHPYTYQTALVIYIGYQITFVFGSYLVRIETLLLHTDTLLAKVDTLKQLGYLLGMGVSYLFYKLLGYFGTLNSQEQVYALHFLLIGVELLVIFFVCKSFKRIM